jgi:succinyl-CoA synthetase beta subunit
MKLHEYQAKEQLEKFGLPVLPRAVVDKPSQAVPALKKLGRGPWVVKAQVHTGGRGKAGGVRVVRNAKEAAQAARDMLGMTLVTHQTGPRGLRVRRVMIEPAVKVRRELYAAATLNRRAGRPALMLSAEGGVDIEAVAAATPEKIIRVDADPARGLEAYQAREAAFAVGLGGELLGPSVKFLQSLMKAFLALDGSLLEINPLAVLAGKKPALLAMDAKMILDDNASFRHAELFAREDRADAAPAEKRAQKAGISYVQLDGDIGCLVNGAGLAMATMDLLKLHGGEPANFLDVGGGANVKQVTEAFKILLSDKKVRAVFVNIFGGIMKCDVIAQGILEAAKAVKLRVPLVARLEGNRVEEGRRILAGSGLNITAAEDLTDGARKVVALAARPA